MQPATNACTREHGVQLGLGRATLGHPSAGLWPTVDGILRR